MQRLEPLLLSWKRKHRWLARIGLGIALLSLLVAAGPTLRAQEEAPALDVVRTIYASEIELNSIRGAHYSPVQNLFIVAAEEAGSVSLHAFDGLSERVGVFGPEQAGSMGLQLSADGGLSQIGGTALPMPGSLDLSSLGIERFRSLFYAPSGDRTDDPSEMSLYVVAPDRIVELSEASPDMVSFAVPVTLVQTIETSTFSPPSPDPAGITYLPRSNRLLIADSEVNEMPLYQGANLFESTVQGNLQRTATTVPWSREPTGLSLNPLNGHIFLSDDDAKKIHEIDLGPDGLIGTADDVRTFFDTRDFDSFDPEDVSYDPDRNRLYIVDGMNDEIYVLTPGDNGVFDAVDDGITSFDTLAFGIRDPEGLYYYPKTGLIYVVGKPANRIAEITVDGVLIQMFDTSVANARLPGGIVFAPASDGSNGYNAYVVDRKIDNNEDPTENDGQVYEFVLTVTLPSTNAPVVDAGPDVLAYEDAEVALAPASFTDVDTQNTHTATIDWGDGTVEAGTVTQGAGSGSVDGKHIYTSPGVYTVVVNVTDDGMLGGSDSFEVTVVNGFVRFCSFATDDRLKLNDRVIADCASVPDGQGGSTGSGLAGNGEIQIEEEVKIRGNVISTGKKIEVGEESLIHGNLTARGDIEVDKDSTIDQDIHSGAEVELKEDVVVGGDVTAAQKVDINKSATVNGTVTQFGPAPVIPAIEGVQFSVSGGGNDIEVKNRTLRLPPGVYKKIEVDDDATLVLFGGNYSVEEVVIKKNAKIEIDFAGAPLVLNVEKEFETEEGVEMVIVSELGDAADILIRAEKNITLDKKGNYLGTFLTRDEIKLDENSTLVGALYGKKVEVKKSVQIVGMPAFELFAAVFVNPTLASVPSRAYVAVEFLPVMDNHIYLPSLAR